MRPTIVCLCGSTRFPIAFATANRDETLAGNIVLSVGFFGHAEPTVENFDRIKPMLDRLHLEKILLADEILVLNVNGYIGQSTRNEIAFAKEHGKTIRYLEDAI